MSISILYTEEHCLSDFSFKMFWRQKRKCVSLELAALIDNIYWRVKLESMCPLIYSFILLNNRHRSVFFNVETTTHFLGNWKIKSIFQKLVFWFSLAQGAHSHFQTGLRIFTSLMTSDSLWSLIRHRKFAVFVHSQAEGFLWVSFLQKICYSNVQKQCYLVLTLINKGPWSFAFLSFKRFFFNLKSSKRRKLILWKSWKRL